MTPDGTRTGAFTGKLPPLLPELADREAYKRVLNRSSTLLFNDAAESDRLLTDKTAMLTRAGNEVASAGGGPGRGEAPLRRAAPHPSAQRAARSTRPRTSAAPARSRYDDFFT
jgi:hypothetical protein